MPRLHVRTLAALLPALLLPAAGAFAAEARLSADAYVSAANANGNFGAAASIFVGGAGTRRSFIRFDLATLPPGSTGTSVARANLILFADTATAGSTFNVARVTGAWTESAITNNLAPTIGAVVASAVPLNTANSFAVVDVTALVKDWLNGTLPNNGLALLPNAGASIDIDSKENANTSHPPRLEVILVGPAGPQGPIGLTGAPGASGPAGPQGPIGPAGPAGAAGAVGPIGPAGPAGVAGAAGPAGPIGPAGPAGVTGATGPAGPAGATGAAGATGPAGASGPAGPTGAQGPPGVTFARTVLVSPVGTAAQNGVALQAAVSSISGASPSNPYLVRIEPGVYDLGSQFLLIPSSVDVEGSGVGVTKLISSGSAVIILPAASELRNISVEGTAGGAIQTAGRLLNVYAKASGGNTNTAISAGSSSESFTNVTAVVSGPGVVNRGMQIYGNITLTNVIAESSGSTSTGRAIDYIGNSGSPRFVNVYAHVVGAQTLTDTAHAISMQGTSSGTLMSVYALAENGGQVGGTVAFYTSQGTHTITNSTLATKGPFVRPAIQANTSSFVRVENSQIMTSGNAYSVSVDSGTTIHIAASRVEGTPFLLFGQGTVVCSGVYNASLTFFPNTCP